MGNATSIPKNTDANLSAISNATENIQYISPEEANKKRNTELYNKYLAAKETVVTAPAAERDAEKAYYTATEGSDGYAKRTATRAATEAAQQKARLVAANAKDMAEVAEALGSYATTARYASNLDGVVMAQLVEVIDMADAVQAGKSLEATNNRKSAFLDAERSFVANWDSHLTVGLWVLAFVYAKAKVLPQPTNVRAWGVLSVLVASPWLLGIVGWLVGRRIPPFNAYTTFSS